MQLDLHRLLDEDKLSPQQERYIRKLVDYELYKEIRLNTGVMIYSLSYIIPNVDDQMKRKVSGRTPEELRTNAYGNLMRYVINHYSNSVTDPTAVNQIKSLIKSHTSPHIDEDFARDEFHFNLNGEFNFIKERDFKYQLFYKILTTVMEHKTL